MILRNNRRNILLQFANALDGLFSAQCPDFFEGTGQAEPVFENFEDYSGKFSGSITKETEPFCGRYSVKNPNLIFTTDNGLALLQYSKVSISNIHTFVCLQI